MEDIQRLRRVCKVIADSIGKDLPLSQLRIFLEIIHEPGITQSDIAERMGGLPSGSISRNVRVLAYILTKNTAGQVKKRGYGLIRQEPDLYEPRKLSCTLTAKGEAVAKEILEALQ